ETWEGPLGTMPFYLRALLWLAIPGLAMSSFGFSCWAAGALVGRFGAGTRARDSAEVGGIVALGTCALVDFANPSHLTYLAAAAVPSLLGCVVGGGGAGSGARLPPGPGTPPPPPAAP